MKELPWRDCGVWLVGDTHMHYRNVGLERLAAEASARCGFIGVTSHANRTEFFRAQPELIARARCENPELVIINGVEWNPPVGKHATVLAPEAGGGMEVLEQLIGRFDRQVAGAEGKEVFLEALSFLGGFGQGDLRPTVILNHPSAPPGFGIDDLRDGMDRGPALVGFCGGGGHSAWPPLGGDAPAGEWASEVGGVYDTLLAEGRSPVMIADGDFHLHASDAGSDFWPGEFSRSFVCCPERSEAGVFAGLRSGAAYFVLGPVIESLSFELACGGASAMIGETLSAGAGGVEARLSLEGAGAVEAVELIGNPRGRVEVVASASGGELERSGSDARWQVDLPDPAGAGGYYVRARGRGTAVKPVVGKVGVMWFYTGAVRVAAAGEGVG